MRSLLSVYLWLFLPVGASSNLHVHKCKRNTFSKLFCVLLWFLEQAYHFLSLSLSLSPPTGHIPLPSIFEWEQLCVITYGLCERFSDVYDETWLPWDITSSNWGPSVMLWSEFTMSCFGRQQKENCRKALTLWIDWENLRSLFALEELEINRSISMDAEAVPLVYGNPWLIFQGWHHKEGAKCFSSSSDIERYWQDS